MRKIIIITILLSITSFSGCKLLDAAADVAAATGVMSSDQAQYVKSGAKVAGKAFDAAKDITPEQEYYIGRAVGATILKTYKPYENRAVNTYINTIGQALAMASDNPETFGGYHFLVLDTDEINAFGAPGGLIFVSRGLLRYCKNEDMLAAVLAHEVGHVQNKHGLRAIKSSRWSATAVTALAETGKSLGGQQVAELTSALEGTISDITSTMVNSGYARKLETEADNSAVTILARLGYNPSGLKDMLQEMDKRMNHNGPGFAKTHPDPKVRIKDITSLIDNYGPVTTPTKRQERFKKALAGI
ncbi:M48 family metalloprotease [Verrucomicrobiota bacterium]